MTYTPLQREVLRDLRAVQCVACGRLKSERQSHCSRCYFTLPGAVRKSLYHRVGHGYEEAYLSSLKLLGTGPALERHARLVALQSSPTPPALDTTKGAQR